jgi:diaminopimelate decarboxylase
MHDYSSIPTPFYLYDLDLLDQTLSVARDESSRYDFKIHYATKANYDARILERMRRYGFGVDCVSGNEVSLALESGFVPESIVFAGVGKTDPEIELAIRNKILCLNVESIEELMVVDEIAERLKLQANIALRLNPDIPALTHKYISTGLKENKFGIPIERLQEALDFCKNHHWINFLGLHFHIGSQITSLQPYRELCHLANRIWENYHIDRFGGRLINMGGGLGIDYVDPWLNPVPDFRSYFKVFADNLLLPKSVTRHFELGRSLTAQCGTLVTRVIFVKQGSQRKYVILDAGMTELIRPALYGASHLIENISSGLGHEIYDVVGPICESSDFFGKAVSLSETRRGDLIRIHSCGAYAESMSMKYNLRGTIGKVYREQEVYSPNRLLQTTKPELFEAIAELVPYLTS